MKFLRDLLAYWRSPEDKWLKVAVYVGFVVHISILLSLWTGWWNEFFVITTSFQISRAGDFFAIYIAGHDLIEGGTIYSTAAERLNLQDVVPYFYPFRYLPTAALVGVVLNAFSPWTAYCIWVAISEILFFVCILWLGRHFGTMRHVHIAAAFYLFFTPFYPELYLGQFDLLQSVFILGMLLTAAGGKLGRMQVWWPASVLWKMNTAICFPALIRWRLWRPILWLVLFIVITCLPYFIFHPDDVSKFFFTNIRIPGRADLAELGIQFPFAGPEAARNYGFQGVVTKLTLKEEIGTDIKTFPIYNFLSMGIILLIGIWATIRARDDRLAECISLWVTAYFLVYTNVLVHHYLMVLPVVAFLYLKRPGILPLIVWILLAFPARHLAYAGSFLPNWNLPFIKPVAALILFAYCVYWTVSKTGSTPAQGRQTLEIELKE